MRIRLNFLVGHSILRRKVPAAQARHDVAPHLAVIEEETMAQG